MVKPKILRTPYKNLTQSSLLSFAKNVCNRMSSLPEYAAFAADVTLLGQQLQQYEKALSLAVPGGVDRTAQKKECIKNVFQTLDRIVDQLNFNHTGQASWGINAGMVLGHGKKRHPFELLAPFNLQVQRPAIPGEAILRFKMPEPRRVRVNSSEYSLDHGVTWHPGEYSSNSKIHLKGLPSKKTIWFRVCSTGAAQRKSEWTEMVEGFVW